MILISLNLIWLCCLAAAEETVKLPLIGQDSLKRKYLQRSKEFITGIRALVDNSHIPLVSMEYQIQIHSSIAEVVLIQEYQNLVSQIKMEAEFYYQIKLSQAFVSLEVSTNGHLLQGVIFDKKNEKQKKVDEGDYEIIPAAYAEILEDVHDIMRLNLGLISPGQSIKITLKYLEQLERITNDRWKFIILASSIGQNKSSNKNLPSETSQDQQEFEGTEKNQSETKIEKNWKIIGQISSSFQIKEVYSSTHSQSIKYNRKSNLNYNQVSFELNYGANFKDFQLIYAESNEVVKTHKMNELSQIYQESLKEEDQQLFFMNKREGKEDKVHNETSERFRKQQIQNVQNEYMSCKTDFFEREIKETQKEKNEILFDDISFFDFTSSSELPSLTQNNEVNYDFEERQDLIISTGSAHIGYDSNDKSTPYVALIRFPALKSIVADESQSSCDSGRRQELLKQKMQQSQFLNNNQNKSDDPESKKNVRKLTFIIENENTQNNNTYINIVSLILSEISENTIFNVIFVANKNQGCKQLFSEFQIASPLNKEVLFEKMVEHFREENTKNEEDEQLPQQKIVGNVMKELFLEEIIEEQLKEKGYKRSSFIIIGGANYWNSDQVMITMSTQRNFQFYFVAVGDNIQQQFLERIELLLGSGKAFQIQNEESVKQIATRIAQEIKGPIFIRFTVVSSGRSVTKMTQIGSNANAISLFSSHSIYAFLNKNFSKSLKKSKSDNIPAITFTLSAFDEENRVYSSVVHVYFYNVKQTNTLHKLSAHSQIQNILSNALYRSEQAFNSQLVALSSSAYEKILTLSIKYQILSENTAFFLLDSTFLTCTKAFLQLSHYLFLLKEPNEYDLNEEEKEQRENEEEEEDKDEENIKYEDFTNLNQDQIKDQTVLGGSCGQMENSLDLQNIIVTKFTDPIQIRYQRKVNSVGNSLRDIFNHFKSLNSQSFSRILSTLTSFVFLSIFCI